MSDEKTIRIIERLPEDIKKQIYRDYFEPKLLYDELIQIVRSKESQNLCHFTLSSVLPKILSNEILVKYLLKQEREFNVVYNLESCKTLQKNKYYYDNFAMLWLFNLYFLKICKNQKE